MPPNRFCTAASSLATSSKPADIDLGGHHIGVAALGDRRQFCGGLSQPLGADIGDADLHAEAGEPHRGRKPDAGRASGDHGDMIGGHGGMGHADFLRTQIGLDYLSAQIFIRTTPTTHEPAWQVFIPVPLPAARSALRFGPNAIVIQI